VPNSPSFWRNTSASCNACTVVWTPVMLWNVSFRDETFLVLVPS
jgi:hypothetical protein